MNRLFQISVGVCGTLGFAAFGAWILWWCAGMVTTSRASVGWPVVDGVVVESRLDQRGEPTPRVTYRYEVDGRSLSSDRLGFDVFAKPGGRGNASTRVERYPVGAAVRVYYDPDDPERAVLEPGDVSPFLMPAFFGLLFLALSTPMGVSTARYALGIEAPQLSAGARARIVGLGTSALIFAILVLVSFDSAVVEVQARALGGSLGGWSPTAVFLGLQAVLFAPIPFVAIRAAAVLEWARTSGRPVGGVASLLAACVEAIGEGGAPARAGWVTLGGLGYFAAIVASWIAFAASRGI